MKHDRGATVVEASGLFDREWYLAEYPDVAASGMDPLSHYLNIGARLLRDPGPNFNARTYQIVERRSLGVGDNPLVHYLSGRENRISDARGTKALRVAIKIAVPNQQVKKAWGDYHFATALQRAFECRGHLVRIDLRPAWEGMHCRDDQVVLSLRGRVAYSPCADQLNLMWNISHPESVAATEYESYDHVFVASHTYAKKLAQQLNVTVEPLLQCTDPYLFHRQVLLIKPRPGLLFVGNSRNVYRPIVRDAVSAGLRPEVYGMGWEPLLAKDLIKGEYIPNEALARYYRSCSCLLNDHWDDMRSCGFLSNRLFDAAACGARIISDRVDGLYEVFGEAVTTYNDSSELPRLIDEIRLPAKKSARQEISSLIRERHSFGARVDTILDRVENLFQYDSRRSA